VIDEHNSYLGFGERLRKARKNANLTQESLGNKLNITKTHIHHLEKGTRYPSIQLLVELSDIFNISIDYFLTGQHRTYDRLDMTMSKLSQEKRDLLADILNSFSEKG